MKTRFLPILALAAAMMYMISSCGQDDPNDNPPDGPDDKERTEIIISTAVYAHTTRATFTGTDTQLPAGQSVAVWVHESKAGSPQLYGKNILTANGSGGLSGGTTMFFPQNDNNVDIYALHTNATLSGDAYPASSLTHTVGSDQRTLANYAESDLLYAKTTSVAKTTNAIPLAFHHLLSKLQIAIVVGDGLTSADITGISVSGTKLQANYTLDKAANPSSIVISPAGTASSIKIGTDISTNFTSPNYNDAIIVPQTLTANTPFITLHLAEGVDLAYLIPGNTTFESKKKYIYHITVSRTEITVSTSIVDWISGGIVSGEASHLVN